MGVTFSITLIAWVFFRAETIKDALLYLAGIFSGSLFTVPEIFPKTVFLFIAFLLSLEWIQRNKQHALEFSDKNKYIVLRWILYIIITAMILFFPGNQQ